METTNCTENNSVKKIKTKEKINFIFSALYAQI